MLAVANWGLGIFKKSDSPDYSRAEVAADAKRPPEEDVPSTVQPGREAATQQMRWDYINYRKFFC
jgi:hypothetical protein